MPYGQERKARITAAWRAFRDHPRFVVDKSWVVNGFTVYEMKCESVFKVNKYGWVTTGLGDSVKHPVVDDVMKAIATFEGWR